MSGGQRARQPESRDTARIHANSRTASLRMWSGTGHWHVIHVVPKAVHLSMKTNSDALETQLNRTVKVGEQSYQLNLKAAKVIDIFRESEEGVFVLQDMLPAIDSFLCELEKLADLAFQVADHARSTSIR
jgi:hypothetical protein